MLKQVYHIVAVFVVLFLALTNSVFATEQKRQLRILTSMSERVYGPYVLEFEKLCPDIDVLVLNKNTNHALGEVSLGNRRAFDIFWASSPEAFDMLEAFDHLNESAGKSHSAFALSSVGWSWLTQNAIEVPQDWNDLLDPKFSGRVGIARPSRSGTTHLLIEQFLQDRGWDDGWQFIFELSANLATITSRSFGVIDGLKSKRFDIGLNIDFLATSEQELSFRYGRPVMLVPARIARLVGGGDPDAADLFIAFVLSDAGQKMLLAPSLNRVPINKNVRETVSYDKFPALQSALKLSWASYDPKLAAQRYWMVNEIFDQFITNQFERRRDLWRRLRELERRELSKEVEAHVNKARSYLVTIPIREYELAASQLNVMPGPGSRYAPLTPEQKALQVRWQTQATMMLNLAAAELASAEKAQ